MSSLVMAKYKGLVPSQVRDCKVCMHKEQGEYLTKIYEKRISVSVAAREMGVSYQQWRNHLKYCVKNAVETALVPEVESIAEKVVDYANELVGQLDRVNGIIKGIEEDVRAEDDNDKKYKMLGTLTMFEKQIGSTIEMMARLAGDLNNSAVMNVSNVKIEYSDFKTRIMDNICSSCKEKILDIESGVKRADDFLEVED